MTNIDLLREFIWSALRSNVNEAVDFKDPEFRSIDAFAEFLADEDRTEFTYEELTALNTRLHTQVGVIRKALEDYGFKLSHRPNEKRVRGFTTSSNDRWYGPGSLKTHGGAGIDNSTGRATVKGKTV